MCTVAWVNPVRNQRSKVRRSFFHPYSTRNCIHIWYPRQTKSDKQHETDMTNAMAMQKCPTQAIFHLLALGLALGLQGFVLGPHGFALGAQGCLDTNMATQIARVGSHTQHEAPMLMG